MSVNKESFRYRFPHPAQPCAVIVWRGEVRTCRAVRPEESGFEEVHIRWPAGELEDFDCDEPHKVSQAIAKRLADYAEHRRTAEEIAEFEAAVLGWIMEQRAAASLRAHEH